MADEAAALPPSGLEGLDPEWSRLITVDDLTWHLLERPAEGTAELTVLAVHGNPTWSYLWRRLLAGAPRSWRVIAVDQIGMGFSQRPGPMRRLAQRIDDLDSLTAALGIDGPVVTVAHDWGGPVSLGWALRHRHQLRGCVLTNTAVHQPRGARAPELIRLARWRPLRTLVTQSTPTFTRGTTTLSRVRGRRLPKSVVAGFQSPYDSAVRRRAVGDFVADIPLEPDHPSAATLDDIAEGIRGLDVPVLLAWGADDPVFSDRYCRDLLDRMPQADVHRYERAGHLVTEDAPEAIDDIIEWIDHLAESSEVALEQGSVPARALAVQRDDDALAIADLGTGHRVSWALLSRRVDELAAGMQAEGIAPGDRVALLVPPGADLVASVYACWSLGACVVVADRGLGLSGMRRALRGSAPEHVIAIAPGLAITRDLDIPGLRILVGSSNRSARRSLGASMTFADLARVGRRQGGDTSDVPPGADADPLALVAFTSGSTGPAKGVAYTRSRIAALIDAITRAYDLDPADDALVAAFAPWVVLGPALGIPSAIPDMDVTDPSTLTMDTFTAAADAVGGTIAWTSPTGVRALIDSAHRTDRRPQRLRLLMVAGAPTPVPTLEALADAFPGVQVATPYGMTEALPLTEVDLGQLREAGDGPGVLVGAPLEGVDVRIAPLDEFGRPASSTDVIADVTGEVVIRAPWSKDAYDRRWAIQHRTGADGWHRTGDVGRLDAHGRLWIEGRLTHVIVTPDGPVTPVAVEDAAARAAGTPMAACVGVGPKGRQVVVVVLPGGGRRMSVADVDVTIAVRAAVRARCGVDVAAVLTVDELPVDIRHRSKIDRTRLARRASVLLAGSAARGGH